MTTITILNSKIDNMDERSGLRKIKSALKTG